VRIHCDDCGREFDDALAIEVELEDGEVLCFCSEDCAARKGYHATYRDPGRDEDASAADER
jgi:hypothetical protein